MNATRHSLASLLRGPNVMSIEVDTLAALIVEDPNCPETPEEAQIWAEIAVKRRLLREAGARVFRDLEDGSRSGRGKRLIKAVKELEALDRYGATSRRQHAFMVDYVRAMQPVSQNKAKRRAS
ncbi:MAG TPA: hypothetical protein VLR92_09160 [Blastocatellia bacterium]|nr:hypothetical protein [Blastocatellia bacterium]